MTHLRAMLVEYSLAIPPLAIAFDLNPQTLNRTRTVTLPSTSSAGARGGYDFTTPLDTPRAALGVKVQPETLSIEVMLDGSEQPDGLAAFGVEPQLDVLRTMLEPKTQGPTGVRILASLQRTPGYAFQRDESASVILFVWGTHVLPVFLTSVRVDEVQHLSTLVPVRARVTMSMQVIEGANTFFLAEKVRQLAGAARYGPLEGAMGGAG